MLSLQVKASNTQWYSDNRESQCNIQPWTWAAHCTPLLSANDWLRFPPVWDSKIRGWSNCNCHMTNKNCPSWLVEMSHVLWGTNACTSDAYAYQGTLCLMLNTATIIMPRSYSFRCHFCDFFSSLWTNMLVKQFLLRQYFVFLYDKTHTRHLRLGQWQVKYVMHSECQNSASTLWLCDNVQIWPSHAVADDICIQ